MNILCARTHSNDIWIENELLSMSIFFCMFVGTYIVTVSTQQRYPFGCKMHDFVWRSSYKFESEISFAVQYYTRTLIMCQMECWKLSEYSKKKTTICLWSQWDQQFSMSDLSTNPILHRRVSDLANSRSHQKYSEREIIFSWLAECTVAYSCTCDCEQSIRISAFSQSI